MSARPSSSTGDGKRVSWKAKRTDWRKEDAPATRTSDQPRDLKALLEAWDGRKVEQADSPLVDQLGDDDLRALCQLVPKVELHAHLSGTILPSTLEELHLAAGGDLKGDTRFALDEWAKTECAETTWAKTVEAFKTIQKLTASDLSVFKRIVAEAAEFYARDGCVYWEVRTGLKRLPDKRTFLAELVAALGVAQGKAGLVIRLLVSVDRGQSVEEAAENIEIAIEACTAQSAAGGRGMVVGVEMGGHPLRGEWAKLEPLFAKARAAGLKVSLHFAENRGWEEEQNAILDFAPERVGHAVYMSDAIRDRLLASRIPVEVCVTCHESYYKVAAANNVFGMLRSREHPAVLCCDNAGLLNTSLSNELYLVATTFKLTPRDLAVLLRDGISAAFLEASQKERLVSESEARLMQLLPVLSPDFVPTATARSGSAASGWAFWGPALVIAVGAAGVAVITVAKRR